MSLKDKVLKIKTKQVFSDAEELMITGRYAEANAKLDGLERQYLARKDQLRCDAWLCHCISKQGDYQTAVDIAERIVEENSDIPKHEEAVFDAFIALGAALRFLGRHDESLEICDRTEDILHTMDPDLRKNRARKALVLYHRGSTLISIGEIDAAIEHLSKSSPLFEELGNIRDTSAVLNNTGECYRVMGNLDLALEYYTKGLVYAESAGSALNVATGLVNIGMIHYQKGNLKKAADLIDQSIALLVKDDLSKQALSAILFYAVLVALEQELIEKAEGFINRMQSIDEETDDLFLSQNSRVARALLLKASKDVDNQEEAQILFEQVVNEDITFFEMTVIALLNLCDMLLSELRVSGNEQIMGEIKEYTEMVHAISKDQGSYWLQVETYWLQSQMSLIELDYESAKRLLTQAQLIAEDKGLHQLARRISSEFDALLEEQDTWTKLSEGETPIAERVEAAHIDEQVVRMAKMQETDAPELVKEDPIQFMLVAAYGGFSVVSKEFQKGFKVDESLVSGFLSALTSFSDEVFAMPLDRIKVGDYIMLMRAELPFLFCYVFKGESYSAMQKMAQFIETLQADSQLWKSLETTVTSGEVDHKAKDVVERIIVEIFS